MIGAPGPTLKRPRSAGRLRPRAGWSRPPSARTPDGPTPARSGASTSGSTAANLDDVALAAYLAELHDAGRASSSASMAVAAACFRAKLAGQPTPAGERTARVLEIDLPGRAPLFQLGPDAVQPRVRHTTNRSAAGASEGSWSR